MLIGNYDNYHQIGNEHLEFVKTFSANGDNFKKVDVGGNVDEQNRLVKIAFAYAFSIATRSTTGGEEIEQNKYV